MCSAFDYPALVYNMDHVGALADTPRRTIRSPEARPWREDYTEYTVENTHESYKDHLCAGCGDNVQISLSYSKIYDLFERLRLKNTK